MTRTVRSVVTLLGFMCALAFAPAVLADSQARIVRLSFTDGQVQIDRNVGQGFEKAIINMPIVQGSKLATGDNGRAEVEFEDGSTVRIGPDTILEFTELGLRDDGGKVSAVQVKQGIAYFDIAHKNGDEFRVAFAEDQVSLDRAARFRVTVSDTQVQVAVFKGDLKVQGTEEVAVKKNQTLTLDLEGGQFEVAKGIAEDPLDEWVKAREQYRDTYAANQSYGAPYAGYYGLGDLNYYGNYYYQPAYGWLWRPYYMGVGWDPFFDGYWCWYPSSGYTWVSPYAWGWIPYRYGSWVFIPGWGWGWRPGPWNTWVSVPSVVNPPPNFRLPRATPPPSNQTIVGGGAVPNNPTIWIRARQPRLPDDTGRAGAAVPSNGLVTNPRTGRPSIPGGTPAAGTTGASGSVYPRSRMVDPGMENARGRSDMMRSGTYTDRSGRQPSMDRPSMDRPSAPSRVDSPRMDMPRMDRPSAPSAPMHSAPSMSAPRMDAPRMDSGPRSAPPPSPPPSSGGSGRPPRG